MSLFSPLLWFRNPNETLNKPVLNYTNMQPSLGRGQAFY